MRDLMIYEQEELKTPVDILRNENNGEEIIFDLLLRIRYGVPT